MTVNAVIGIQEIETSQAIITSHHSPVTRTSKVKMGIGVLLAGLLMAVNKDNELIPYEELEASIGTGDGNATSFSGNISNSDPVMPGSIKVVAGGITLFDDGCGNLYSLDDDSGGEINYITGDIVVNFDGAPAQGDVNVNCNRKLVGVLCERCDTEKEDSSIIVVHGTVWSDRLLKKQGNDFVSIEEQDRQYLDNIGVYTI